MITLLVFSLMAVFYTLGSFTWIYGGLELFDIPQQYFGIFLYGWLGIGLLINSILFFVIIRLFKFRKVSLYILIPLFILNICLLFVFFYLISMGGFLNPINLSIKLSILIISYFLAHFFVKE